MRAVVLDTLQADRRLPVPVGTSLLLKATRNHPARVAAQAA